MATTSNEAQAVQPPRDRFRRSHRMCWIGLSCIMGLAIAVIIWPSPEAASVATIAIGSIAGLVGAWTGITNWAEVRGPT